MMTLRGVVAEVPIQWYQALGPLGHERLATSTKNQIKSLRAIAHRVFLERKLAVLKDGEFLPIDAGFDFRAYLIRITAS
ncbi:MAG: hypothetical protein IPK16_01655 [Anaerolineales bacterium]|nr:hypothetical protein [Anaerolineales bacterium]